MQAYHGRAYINSKKVPLDERLGWVSERGEAERTQWVERYRGSAKPLGVIVKTVHNEREACWQPPA